MDQKHISRTQLSDFVAKHKLRNRHSDVHFKAVVSIKTDSDELLNKQMEVMISFENYGSGGQLTLMDSNLDPYVFPTRFDVNWQKMEHIDSTHLMITGDHTRNATIGKYSVSITPLGRIRD